jgi:hypothetical protein
MKTSAATPEQWLKDNAQRLIPCRWGCRITPEACRRYQSRASRHVIYFSGLDDPGIGVNSDFVLCMHPEPCPHLITDAEQERTQMATRMSANPKSVERRSRVSEIRKWDELTNPDRMLNEPGWRRSLVR